MEGDSVRLDSKQRAELAQKPAFLLGFESDYLSQARMGRKRMYADRQSPLFS